MKLSFVFIVAILLSGLSVTTPSQAASESSAEASSQSSPNNSAKASAKTSASAAISSAAISDATKALTVARLEAFSHHIIKETKQSPENIFPYLSDKLEVEANLGSNAQGITLYFDKGQYIRAVQKAREYVSKFHQMIETDVFDYQITSANAGKFTITSYIERYRVKVWTTVFVELEHEELKIVRMEEFD